MYKAYKQLATNAWIKRCARKCTCPGKVHQKLTRHWLDCYGRWRCSGITKQLTASAAYPLAMRKTIFKSWATFTTVRSPQSNFSTSSWMCPLVTETRSQPEANCNSWMMPDMDNDHSPGGPTRSFCSLAPTQQNNVWMAPSMMDD